MISEGALAPFFFTCKRKRFRLSFVSGKKTIPQPELINDCTIPGFKDPPPGRLARSPSRWRHVKNGRTLYQRNLWSRYRDAEPGVPITTVDAAIAYRQRILDAVPAGHDFTPLMTCYLTDSLDADELERGFHEGVFTAAKLYPANATTNSSHGVTSVDAIMPVLERMEKLGIPLLVHGEVTHADVDIFDREARFIDTVMEPLRQRLTALKVVFEHITTKDAAQYVRDGNDYWRLPLRLNI